MSNFEKNCVEVPQDEVFSDNQTDICRLYGLNEDHKISKTFKNLRESYNLQVDETIKNGVDERAKLKEIMVNSEIREADANANVIKLAGLHNQLHQYFDEAA